MGVLIISPFINQLVTFLGKIIKPVNKSISEPVFLTESSLDYPETLIQSMHNELLHLYHNISKLFIKSLQVDGSILDSKHLQKEIDNKLQLEDFNFDEKYRISIEPLIAAIIEFSGKGQNIVTEEQQSQLFELRLACVKLSESVMAINGLKNNMKIYFDSDNIAVRNEYNKMRILILSVLKELSLLEDEQVYDSSLLNLEDIRVQIKKYRKETNARLDKLIRTGRIDSVTATTILNDRTFARDAAKRLLDAGMLLFATKDIEMKKAERIISLSEEDIEDIANSSTPI